MDLAHSKVRRGGVTSPYWYGETDRIRSDIEAEGVRFQFTLPSKGGGETQILLTVGIADLRAILEEVAEKRPELADTFAEATRIAVSGLLSAQRIPDDGA